MFELHANYAILLINNFHLQGGREAKRKYRTVFLIKLKAENNYTFRKVQKCNTYLATMFNLSKLVAGEIT